MPAANILLLMAYSVRAVWLCLFAISVSMIAIPFYMLQVHFVVGVAQPSNDGRAVALSRAERSAPNRIAVREERLMMLLDDFIAEG